MMRTRLAVIVTAMIAALLGAQAAPSSAATDGSITGHVVGPDGPLDVHTWLRVFAYRQSDGEWRSYQGTRHEDGSFEIEGLEPGAYQVFFDTVPPEGGLAEGQSYGDVAPQWFPGTSDFAGASDLIVRAGETTTVPLLTLPRAGHITGRVVDPDGAPLSDFVVVRARALGPFGWQRTVTVGADADGRYDLPLIGDAPYLVEVVGGQFSWPRALDGTMYDAVAEFATTYNGGVADIAAVDPVRGASDAVMTVPTFRAVRNGRLTGTVRGPRGEPLEGIVVTLPDARHSPDYQVTTDVGGHWDAGRLAAGEYELDFWDPSRVYARRFYGDDGAPLPLQRATVSVGATSAATTTLQYAPPRLVTPPAYEWEWDTRVPAGTLLRVDGGRWDPASTVVIQWYRGEGELIPGATGPTYRITQRDIGADVYAHVTATAPPPSETNDALALRVRASDSPGADDDPDGLDNPGIDDPTPSVGQTVRVTHAPDDASGWRWYRDGTPIPGAVDSTYTVGPTDAGLRLEVVATRRDRYGLPRGYAISRPTAPVPGVRPVVAPPRAMPTAAVTLSARSVGHRTVKLTITARARAVTTRALDSVVRISRSRPGSDTVKTARMKNGTLHVTLKNQPRGRRVFYATVQGVERRFTTGTSQRRTVRVR